MEREPSGFPFLEINNILTQLKCLQLVKKWFYHFLTSWGAAPNDSARKGEHAEYKTSGVGRFGGAHSGQPLAEGEDERSTQSKRRHTDAIPEFTFCLQISFIFHGNRTSYDFVRSRSAGCSF